MVSCVVEALPNVVKPVTFKVPVVEIFVPMVVAEEARVNWAKLAEAQTTMRTNIAANKERKKKGGGLVFHKRLVYTKK